MSGTKRIPSNFRLTEECRRMLEELAEQRGVSQAAIIELLVREEHYKQNERTLKLVA